MPAAPRASRTPWALLRIGHWLLAIGLWLLAIGHWPSGGGSAVVGPEQSSARCWTIASEGGGVLGFRYAADDNGVDMPNRPPSGRAWLGPGSRRTRGGAWGVVEATGGGRSRGSSNGVEG